jgi:4-diphosphocytidyl-2-C-methyl-D-erythritol kinase
MVLNSFAKVNLFLKVLRRRPDGYHDIDSIFERISLRDKIIIKKRKDGLIKIVSAHPRVPLDSSNLCYRAAELLKGRYKVKSGVEIRIIKNIPVGAGLGGGSSNAACVMLGLNKLWKLGLSRRKISILGSRIGSDLPFFIYEVPFARVGGKGEIIRPLKSLSKRSLWHLLIAPRLHVSTPVIYRKWDSSTPKKARYSRLTSAAGNVKILLSELARGESCVRNGLFNSLEEITCRLYPEVKNIKKTLLTLGSEAALMSGSGPVIFAVLGSRRAAFSLKRKISGKFKQAQLFVAKTF